MNTSIVSTTCPAGSRLNSYLTKIDFEDAFSFTVSGCQESMESIYRKIFYTAPAWVRYAMLMRNWLVAPLGLKTEMQRQPALFAEGAKVGIFRLYEIANNEVIAGEDDKHLDFRVSVYRTVGVPTTITVSTGVQYHNAFGKLYMTIVAPFHKMVVKSMLKSAVTRFGKAQDQKRTLIWTVWLDKMVISTLSCYAVFFSM